MSASHSVSEQSDSSHTSVTRLLSYQQTWLNCACKHTVLQKVIFVSPLKGNGDIEKELYNSGDVKHIILMFKYIFENFVQSIDWIISHTFQFREAGLQWRKWNCDFLSVITCQMYSEHFLTLYCGLGTSENVCSVWGDCTVEYKTLDFQLVQDFGRS